MKKALLVLGYLTIVYLAFFWPVLSGDTILESGNDARRFGYPVRVYLWERLRQGTFPFWTERMFSGYPIYSDPETGYLNPINLVLVYVFGPFTSYKVLHFVSYSLGSICFILLARGLVKTSGGVVFSHFTYFFSFFCLFHQQHFGITFGYLLFPCFLYLLQRIAVSRKARYVYLFLLLLIHLFYFGAFQMVAIILLASLVYLIIYKVLTRDLLYLSIAPALIFLLLTLPLIISYSDMYLSSERSVKSALWLEGSFAPFAILNFVYPFPYRYGDSYMGVLVNREFLMHEVYIYFGISGFIFALLGVVFSSLERRPNRFLATLILLFIVLGFAKYNPLLSSIDVPIISFFRYWGRSVILAIFALSIFGGHFIDSLTTLHRNFVVRKKNLYFLIFLIIYLSLLEIVRYPTLESSSLVELWLRKDFKFDYLWLYLVFLSFSLLFLYLNLTKRRSMTTSLLLTLLPLMELGIFGNLVLKDAFTDIDKLRVDLSDLESKYINQRIIVADGDVIGNKTLYYKFWSPFGYAATPSRYYSEIYRNAGFESIRKPVLSKSVVDGFNNPNLHRDLKSLGIVSLTDTQGNIYFTEHEQPVIYPKDTSPDNLIVENYRSEQRYMYDVFLPKDEAVSSYIRYDPGWKVVINGNPASVGRDAIFLSFGVPAGVNTVELIYLPHPLYLGLIFVTIGVGFIFLVRYGVRRYPNLKYFLFVAALFLSLRTPHLGIDLLNSDGARWHRRSERFIQAIKSGDLSSTYQHYQPGVTLMWINSVTKKLVWEAQDLFKLPRWSLENAQDFPKIHAVSKFALVSFLSLLLLYQMAIISKIAGLKPTLLYGFFVSIEPFLIGIDRWFHLTSLESYFAFSAFLTYLYSLVIKNRKLYFLAGVFVSLSVLSKLTGFIVFPLIVLIEMISGLYTKELRKSAGNIGIFIVGAAVTFVALFPALWSNFSDVTSKLVEAVVGAVESDTRAQYFKPPFSYIYYAIVLAFKLSPITVIAFLSSLGVFVWKLREKKSYAEGRFILAYLLTFLLVLTISTKKIDRYALALVQPILLFVSIYLAKLKLKALLAILALQAIFAMYTFYAYFPAISGYYSPIFGGAETSLSLGVYENSGEYFAQSAFYLNSLGRHKVYIPDNYESFKYFYYGPAVRDFSTSVKYVVTSVDFDRRTPRIITECPRLIRTFGPKFSNPVVYIYACRD